MRRHWFVPQVSREVAEADAPVVTHRAADGTATSSASQPTIVAQMLDQLDLREGQRVLEVGAGTGYNAALLATLVGPSGEVTTIDIQPDVAAEARDALNRTGHQRVQVVVGDGSGGLPGGGTVDRIIVTAGAWDLSLAWFEQLAVGGRLVVPLRWRGQTQSVAFVREVDHFRAESLVRCGFLPMVGQDGEQTIPIAVRRQVLVTFDSDQALDSAGLTSSMECSGSSAWSGVMIGPEEPISGIWLRLTVTEPGTVRVAATPEAAAMGLCRPAVLGHSPAIVQAGSLAYLTVRTHVGSAPLLELGATAHGPDGEELANRLMHQVRSWDRDRDCVPSVRAWPGSRCPAVLPPSATVIAKPSVALVLAYGDPSLS